eukprot:scaffold297794_cov31-Tisochrysis_lutea.AAC.1
MCAANHGGHADHEQNVWVEFVGDSGVGDTSHKPRKNRTMNSANEHTCRGPGRRGSNNGAHIAAWHTTSPAHLLPHSMTPDEHNYSLIPWISKAA